MTSLSEQQILSNDKMASEINSTLALRPKETQDPAISKNEECISNSSGSRSQDAMSQNEETVSSSSGITTQQSQCLISLDGEDDAEAQEEIRKLINELPSVETLVSFARVLEEYSRYWSHGFFEKGRYEQFQALIQTSKNVCVKTSVPFHIPDVQGFLT